MTTRLDNHFVITRENPSELGLLLQVFDGFIDEFRGEARWTDFDGTSGQLMEKPLMAECAISALVEYGGFQAEEFTIRKVRPVIRWEICE